MYSKKLIVLLIFIFFPHIANANTSKFIGVVGAAKDNINLMLFGLFLSVVLVVTLARFFAEQIKKSWKRWPVKYSPV